MAGFENVGVFRELEFKGDANQGQNVKGYFNPHKLMREYNFLELALDTTNLYSQQLDTDSTQATGSGGLLFTTQATDTRVDIISCGGLHLYPAQNPVVEIKFQLDVVTTVAVNFGLSDAVAASYGSGVLPFTISGTTVSDTTIADGAMFVFDTNQTTDYFYCCYDKNGTQAGSILSSAYALTAAKDVILRVSLDTSGNARYYYNGTEVFYKATAITTTDPFTALFGIRNNAAAAHVAKVRYIRTWVDA
jgi:hypothetical protein